MRGKKNNNITFVIYYHVTNYPKIMLWLKNGSKLSGGVDIDKLKQSYIMNRNVK